MPHCTYVSHCTATVVYTQTPYYCTHKYNKTTIWNSYLSCCCYICVDNKYAPPVPHVPISSYVDITQLCQYIYLIWIQSNQECHHKHWYTYISHYWQMSLNKYACHIICVFPNTLLLYSIYRPHIPVHMHSQSINCNIKVPQTATKYEPGKCASQMWCICHMPELLNVSLWGKYANLYAM